MVKKIGVLILVIIIIAIGGCGRQSPDEAFNIETDWQYQMVDPSGTADSMAEDPEGCVYFVNGFFLYKHDKKTGETAPLCNRPNCLHNQETDPEKIIRCHAFFDFLSENASKLLDTVRVYYEEGYIYLFYTSASTTSMYAGSDYGVGTRIVRVSVDGGNRETVRIMEGEPLTVRLHRGRCYYVLDWFEDNKTEHKEVRVFPLSRPSEDKLIMEMPEDMRRAGNVIYILYAYGRDLFISIFGYSAESGEAAYRMYRYNPEDEKLNEVIVPGRKESQQMWTLTVYQNKLHFFLKEGGEMPDAWIWSGLYTMGMDGSSPHEVTDLSAPRIYSDGNYLYVSNASLVVDLFGGGNEGKNAKVQVYDKDYTLVDTFTEDVYNRWHFDFAMGVHEYGYRMLYDHEDTYYCCLQLFDKSQIGTLDGKKPEFTTVIELTASPADISYADFKSQGIRNDFFDGSFFET